MSTLYLPGWIFYETNYSVQKEHSSHGKVMV